MRHSAFFLSLLVGLSSQAANSVFEKKGESSIRQFKNDQGILETVIKTQDYSVIDTYNGNGGSQSYLLDIQKELTTFDQMEGIRGQLQIGLFKSVQKRFDTQAWQIKENATDWSYLWEPQLIITKLSGCCGAMEGARAFNFATGKLIMSYTPMIEKLGEENAPFIVEVPNTSIYRLVGVMSADSSRDFPEELLKRDSRGYQVVAIIKYSDLNKIAQKIVVKTKVSENFSASIGNAQWLVANGSRNEVRGGKLSLWDADGSRDLSKIGGSSFQLKVFNESGESFVRLPLSNDRFEIEKAEKSSDIELILQ